MKLLLIAIMFIVGVIFCTYSSKELREGFNVTEECPNLLVRKGEELHLTYSNKAKIPGVNPLKFDNLEEYVEFVNWQRAKGIRCPVLFFEQGYDTQNNLKYKKQSDIIIDQGDLSETAIQAQKQLLYDATRDDKPFNQNSYPGMDTEDQYIGAFTPLDTKFESSEKISLNAMDTNWGGVKYSRKHPEFSKTDDVNKKYALNFNRYDC